MMVEHGKDDHDVARNFVAHHPGKSTDPRLSVDDRFVVGHNDRRARVGPLAELLQRRLEGSREPIAESQLLLLLPGLGIDELSRCNGVVLDAETHRGLRLAATCSSTSLQLKVLTSPEAICRERRTISAPQARSASAGSS